MDRREAITQVGLLLGGTIIGSGLFMQAGCRSAPEQVNALFNRDQVILLNEIAETIIPETDTPGAKAAKTGDFMALMVYDCYETGEQKIFIEGMDKLNAACKAKSGKGFMECNSKQRTEILESLDEEQKPYTEKKKPEDPPHYFRMMKELTLLGFFTSETGATKTLRYIAVPGRYDGNMPYKKGDRAWAT